MAITLVDVRRDIEDGDHIFRIYGVENDESGGAVALHFVTADGYRHTERFYFRMKEGGVNTTAIELFSSYALPALNYPENKTIEPAELLNHYLVARIEHYDEPGYNDPTKTYRKIKMNYKRPASGFDTDNPNCQGLKLTQKDIKPALAATKEAMARARKAERQQAKASEPAPTTNISSEVEDLFK